MTHSTKRKYNKVKKAIGNSYFEPGPLVISVVLAHPIVYYRS
jgi:hypothetical protein